MSDTVKYEQGRLLVQDGDIAFIRGKDSPLAWLIRLCTKSKYSHAGICFWITTGNQRRLMFIEAQGKTKRRILNLSYYADEDIDVVKSPKNWDLYAHEALKRIGKAEYSMISAGYVGVREFLLQYLNIKIPELNFPGEICSEFIANMLDMEETNISPQLLFETLQQRGHDVYIQIRN